MSTYFSFKTLINVYRLLRQTEITVRLAEVLSLFQSSIEGDIYNSRSNLKKFLIGVLRCYRGEMPLDLSGNVQLFYRSALHDANLARRQFIENLSIVNNSELTLNINNHEKSSVCIKVRVRGEVWKITEDETLELIQSIYNKIRLNSYKEQEVQNFFGDDWFHASSDKNDRTDRMPPKKTQEQSASVQKECKQMKIRSISPTKQREKYQYKVVLTEQDERRPLNRDSASYIAATSNQPQLKNLKTHPRKSTQKPAGQYQNLSSRAERMSLPHQSKTDMSDGVISLPRMRVKVKTYLEASRQMSDSTIELWNVSKLI